MIFLCRDKNEVDILGLFQLLGLTPPVRKSAETPRKSMKVNK